MKLNRDNLAQLNRQPRSEAGRRIVHIGLGAFHRAHQAWYTSRVDREQNWGIKAFTVRSAEMAQKLEPQDGLFNLVTRGPLGDSYEIVDSIVSVADGSVGDGIEAAIALLDTAVVMLTITEAGYAMDNEGHVDVKNAPYALARLAAGLELRRNSHGKGLAVVPCDNMPSNGQLLKVAISDLFAAFYGKDALEWLNREVSFVSTSVDRITPKTIASDIEQVEKATGWQDDAPVVTEPFSDWILSGDFPLGRPEWERAGATFVAEIEPFERRKLWLLNGAHSLLAYAGLATGHATVAEAIGDSDCRQAVERYWDEACRHLDRPNLKLSAYRSSLLARFDNQRIAHQLAQIAMDGSNKLRVRIAPVARLELEKGNSASGCAAVFAAWIRFALDGRVESDSKITEIEDTLMQNPDEIERALLSLVAPDLADNEAFMSRILEILDRQKI
jgi:fructuronate reductase